MKYIIANWKANKNTDEARDWVLTFNKLLDKDIDLKEKLEENGLKVIICPAFHLISSVREGIRIFSNLVLGAQDISVFDAGSYTGEIPASTLSNMVKYVILGHSERRSLFNESNDVIQKKTAQVLKSGLVPVLCVRGTEDTVPPGVEFIAYEPPHAIGTGNNESLDNVLAMKKNLNLSPSTHFLYGGSVNEKNITFYKSSEIEGFLVGTSSKDPHLFYKLCLQV